MKSGQQSDLVDQLFLDMVAARRQYMLFSTYKVTKSYSVSNIEAAIFKELKAREQGTYLFVSTYMCTVLFVL